MRALLVVMLAGCTAPGRLSEAQLEEALTRAGRADPEALIASVASLVAAHESEEGVRYDPWDPPHRRVQSTAWIAARFEALGMSPIIEETEIDGFPVSNVYAEIPGSTRPDELVLVTAHHDVWFVGADDNCSGVVGMLAAAEALRDAAPTRTIRFVAFDQEETDSSPPGSSYAALRAGSFKGSRHHLGGIDDEALVALINMDAIGFTSREPGSQRSPPGFVLPDVADFITVIGNQEAEDLTTWATQLGPRLPHPARVVAVYGVGDNDGVLLRDLHRSDHAVAWERGWPGLFLTDTTNFRNENYHTEHDTVETLDPEFLASSTELVTALAWAAQGQP